MHGRKRASLDSEREELEKRLAEARSLPNATSTEMTDERDRLRYEVEHLPLVRAMLLVEMEKARMAQGGTSAEAEFLTGYVKTHE